MTKTILLADDSVTIQKVVELTFMDEDFRVVAVGSGTEAMERLAELRPDVVIADVHMPGADGYEVCRASREARSETPVLLLVGTFEVFDAERAAKVGASGYLKKPFDSQELLRRVREMLEVAPEPLPQAAPPAEAPAPAAAEAVPGMDEELWFPVEPAAEEAGSSWSVPAPEPSSWSLAAAAEPAPAAEPQRPEPTPTTPPPPGAIAPAISAAPTNGGALSDHEVERIARRVVELLGDRVVREVAWEVVPDLAEVLLKARIRELETSVE